jgi:hypothetical protein
VLCQRQRGPTFRHRAAVPKPWISTTGAPPCRSARHAWRQAQRDAQEIGVDGKNSSRVVGVSKRRKLGVPNRGLR